MSVLFIAPFPPPVSGNSLAVEVFRKKLSESHQIDVVNINKNSFKNNSASLGRLLGVMHILRRVKQKVKHADVVYFSISESLAGNIKDLFIYLLCFKKLPKTLVHLHGGAGMKLLLSPKKYSVLYKINHFILKRLGGIIVLGESQTSIYSHIVPKTKIHVVPNFAEDCFFRDYEEIEKRYKSGDTINVLFLSNFLTGKGYEEIVSAFKLLPENCKTKITINFAGSFESQAQKANFLDTIKDDSRLKYHGFVTGEQKKNLLQETHVFCLPTYYPYEGQPISILEAYASGCTVITTDHSGIRDVFSDGINGYLVEKRSPSSLSKVFEKVIVEKDRLCALGKNNRMTAEKKYRTGIYNTSLKQIISNLLEPNT